MALILLIVIILLADLAVKSTIEEADPKDFPKELDCTKGVITLHQSLPMGMLKDRPELVRLIPLAVLSAVTGIFLWLFPRKGHRLEKVGAALVLGGGLSNLYDRMKRGYVVDYFSVRVEKLKKIVFNLGDIAVFLGAAVMFTAELIETVRER